MYSIGLWNIKDRIFLKCDYESALKLIYNLEPRYVTARVGNDVICIHEPWYRALVLLVRHHHQVQLCLF